MYQPVPRSGTHTSVIPILDALDCCNTCFATPGCAASAFYKNYVLAVYLNTYLLKPVCELYLTNDTSTCNQRLIGAEQTQEWVYPDIYMSNGPCGQTNFTLWYATTG